MSDKTHRLFNAPRSRTLLAVTLVVLLTATLAMSACISNSTGKEKLTLATTTSTQDSGLLDYLIPKFEKKYNVDVKVVSVGSGQALALGQTGDADVLLVHSKAAELDFVSKGYGLWRKDVMYNWFMIVGPASDPANISALNNTITAFKYIAWAGANGTAIFCTRGDGSGTVTKELGYWNKTGIKPDPKTDTWYLNLSQGMGETLNTCNEKKAYTLSDSATWWSMTDNLPNLKILMQNDPTNLKNQYGVIPVNGSNGPHVNTKLGLKFANWIVDPATQDIISQYKRHDQQLFFPNAS
jgi:tungstate transport system substrate-binding protein